MAKQGSGRAGSCLLLSEAAMLTQSVFPCAHTRPTLGQAMHQEKLCKMPGRFAKIAEMSLDRVKKAPKTPYSWIFGREA